MFHTADHHSYTRIPADHLPWRLRVPSPDVEEPRELRLEALEGKNRVAAAAVVEERKSWAARGGVDASAAVEALDGHRASVVRRTLRLHTTNDYSLLSNTNVGTVGLCDGREAWGGFRGGADGWRG